MSQTLKPQSPPSVTEESYCRIHLELLKLFCEDDQITICSKCFQLPVHKHHLVYEIHEAAENYRKLFKETLHMLKGKLEVAKSILADEQERMVRIQEEEQSFKKMVEAEYKMRFRLLREETDLKYPRQPACKFDQNLNEAGQNQLGTELEQKSQETLQRLNRLGRENMSKLKASEFQVAEQLCSLQRITTELEKKCGEPVFTLLQNARYNLERSESLLLQSLEPAEITDLSSCLIQGMSKVLMVFQRHITLDPETAHPCLVLSEDLKSMRLGNTPPSVPDTPRRFDFGASVLAAESFLSGRHYWEVAVGQASNWQLGICDCVGRKSNRPQVSGDKVLLMGSMMGADYTFWIFPSLRKICLRKKMYKVGIFVDCDHGQMSFYNVTESSLIYNFSDLTFQGAVRPVFSLCVPNGDMNSDSLTICPPHTPS
ncbi:probable E3 ubiquitin-protein ligase TRIML2 [Nannospalax galili]|uniref:Tripartite motif family-like 2 n=1 Tax=Nannospalax galili TaxID=1026970 RepID=A0A8C6QL53_NANGA|nr:probable E3 ubiquitin-protein ligase TRIML2 [Nannospalax galili]